MMTTMVYFRDCNAVLGSMPRCNHGLLSAGAKHWFEISLHHTLLIMDRESVILRSLLNYISWIDFFRQVIDHPAISTCVVVERAEIERSYLWAAGVGEILISSQPAAFHSQIRRTAVAFSRLVLGIVPPLTGRKISDHVQFSLRGADIIDHVKCTFRGGWWGRLGETRHQLGRQFCHAGLEFTEARLQIVDIFAISLQEFSMRSTIVDQTTQQGKSIEGCHCDNVNHFHGGRK